MKGTRKTTGKTQFQILGESIEKLNALRDKYWAMAEVVTECINVLVKTSIEGSGA